MYLHVALDIALLRTFTWLKRWKPTPAVNEDVGIATDLFGLDTHTAVPTHKEFALIPAALLKRGYAEGAVEKIIGGNFMRLFREVTGSGS